MSSIEELGGEINRVENSKRSNRKEKIPSAGLTSPADSLLQLSEKSFSLENVEKSIKELPDIPASRIKEIDMIKNQIKKGTYVIDQKKLDGIAKKLLEGSELGLGILN